MADKREGLMMTRRRALGVAAALFGSLVVPRVTMAQGANAGNASQERRASPAGAPQLPVDEIQQIVGLEGEVSRSVLGMNAPRGDIGNVAGPNGVTFTPAFQIHGDMYFQPIGPKQAFLNADMALLPNEINPFISALLKNGLVLQAYHQHMPMMEPQIWFVHFRGAGDPLTLAKSVRAALDTTATPLPYSPAKKPGSTLDHNKLASILHGDAEVGEEGVVTVIVDRSPAPKIAGMNISPKTNVSTNIEFKPLGEGNNAAVVPDFAMTANEVNRVVGLMLDELHWFQGCLYNQETDEHPQLYFDHMLKTGDAYQLAREIRRGLDLTQSK